MYKNLMIPVGDFSILKEQHENEKKSTIVHVSKSIQIRFETVQKYTDCIKCIFCINNIQNERTTKICMMYCKIQDENHFILVRSNIYYFYNC